MTILDQLADHARERVRTAEKTLSFAQIRRQALSLPKGGFAFEKALAGPAMSFICEFFCHSLLTIICSFCVSICAV